MASVADRGASPARPPRARRSSRVVAMLVCVLAAGLLVALGAWQLQRREWKNALVAQIAARAAAPPAPLPQILDAWGRGEDVSFARVRLSGTFQHAGEMALNTVVAGVPGWAIITPFVTRDGTIALVERGFVPAAYEKPATRTAGQTVGQIEIVGAVRPADIASAFTPANDIARNRWFTRDVKAMAATLQLGGARLITPFVIAADPLTTPASGLPRAGTLPLAITNRHLEYALTWFGLALTLVIMAPIVLWRTRRD